MADNELTTIQIDKETFKLLKELAQADLRSTPKEFAWIIQKELASRTSCVETVSIVPQPIRQE